MNEVTRPGNGYISSEAGSVRWSRGNMAAVAFSNSSTIIYLTTEDYDRLIEETCGDTFLSFHS